MAIHGSRVDSTREAVLLNELGKLSYKKQDFSVLRLMNLRYLVLMMTFFYEANRVGETGGERLDAFVLWL